MRQIAVQYLENVPGVTEISPGQARAKLRAAFDLLPISHLLLGWNLPRPLVDACREEARLHDAQFFLWHPLLTGDSLFFPKPEWRTIGLQGEPVPGFRGMPEFTFVCPNKPPVREAVLDHFRQVMGDGEYDGVFLDRMRFPSPAADPSRWLACFCDDCSRAAAEDGLDLEEVRGVILEVTSRPDQILSLLQILLGSGVPGKSDPHLSLLNQFLDFRSRSITRIVGEVAHLAQTEGLAVGLDCFAPALTRSVGQDLASLDAHGEWTKLMAYGHTLGPAGLPFELLKLARWVTVQAGVGYQVVLAWLSQATGLPLPDSEHELRTTGIPAAGLAAEMKHGRARGVTKLWAGIELVEIEGVTQLNDAQITADLLAIRSAGMDGLVLSWDLWQMPLEWLKLVNEVWCFHSMI